MRRTIKIVKMDQTCKIIQWNVQGISRKKDNLEIDKR